MELLQLKYFAEIARLGSVTKAANELHVSQPSLSQTMRRLECELGVKLFEKEGRMLKLTVQGQKFYSRVSIALQDIANAASELKRRGIQGNIILGSYVPLQPIIPSLREFVAQNPDITFTFLRISNLAYINSKNMDALLCYDQSDGLNFRERLYITSTERVIILPNRDMPVSDNLKLRLQDLSRETFVSLQWDNDRVEEIFDEFNYNNLIPNIRYYTNSSFFKQELMESGLAAGFTNSIIANQLHDTGNYLRGAHLMRTSPVRIYLAWRATGTRSEAANEFKKFMQSKFSSRNRD